MRWGALTLAACAVVLVWVIAAAGLRAVFSDRVLPRTDVAGVNLGGTTKEEARRRLRALRVDDRRVTLRHEQHRVVVRAADAGLSLDVDATSSRAMRAGRGGPADGFVSALTRLVTGAAVAPVYRVDRRRLEAAVEAIGRRVNRRPFHGDLSIDPVSLTVTVVPPQQGRTVDRPTTAAALVDALREDRPTAAIITRETPTAPRGDIVAVARQARAYLARPLRLTRTGPDVTVRPSRLAPALTVEAAGGGAGRRVRLGVRRKRLAALVRTIAEQRDRGAVDARFRAPAAPVTIADKGDLAWRPRPATVMTSGGRSGVRVDRRRAIAAITAAVRERRHIAPLPVEAVRPSISAEDARRVRRLIGTFTTRFACCEARVTNIRRIARAVDGSVIAPGGQFSLNSIAGPRTRAKGYVPAPFIADGKLVPSVGGGVSQFATTMFNAAYFAGLQLDAHQPHSIYIDRYPAGREATLDYGSIDLRWTNDTHAPVLVRASSTATSVTVTLYGNNGGRRVRARSNGRRRAPGRDFTLTVTRVIRYADGRVVTQPYTTTYDRPPSGG